MRGSAPTRSWRAPAQTSTGRSRRPATTPRLRRRMRSDQEVRQPLETRRSREEPMREGRTGRLRPGGRTAEPSYANRSESGLRCSEAGWLAVLAPLVAQRVADLAECGLDPNGIEHRRD